MHDELNRAFWGKGINVKTFIRLLPKDLLQTVTLSIVNGTMTAQTATREWRLTVTAKTSLPDFAGTTTAQCFRAAMSLGILPATIVAHGTLYPTEIPARSAVYSGKHLSQAIAAGQSAAGKVGLRSYSTVLHFNIDGSRTKITGTDGFVLSAAILPGASEHANFTLSLDACRAIEKLAAKTDNVMVGMSDGRVIVRGDSWHLAIEPSAVQFPNTADITKMPGGLGVLANTKDLLNSARAILPLTDKKLRTVYLDGARLTQDVTPTAINCEYILRLLRTAKSETVKIFTNKYLVIIVAGDTRFYIGTINQPEVSEKSA